MIYCNRIAAERTAQEAPPQEVSFTPLLKLFLDWYQATANQGLFGPIADATLIGGPCPACQGEARGANWIHRQIPFGP